MINLELYKIFVIVANDENITRAGEKLNLTQPAVTKHIKNLERLIGLKLFVRTNHGIKLTKSVRDLYNEIKESINLLINAENKYLKVRDINLGIHSTILNNIFSECISQYYITKLKSKINIINAENEQMLLEFKNGNIDIIFSKRIDSKCQYKGITFIKLGEWNDVLISNKDYNLYNNRLTIGDLKKCTIYMPKKTSETPSNFFKSLHCKYEDFKNIKHVTYNTIIEIIKNNEGVGLVTKEFVTEKIMKNNLRIIDTEFKIKPIEFGIYINKDNKFENLNVFIQIIKDKFIDKQK